MKSKTINPKYIEWRSPEEMHEIALTWISELKFIKDEQHFLDELLESFSLQMLSDKNFAKSKTVINGLSDKRKAIEPMLKKIINHHNKLTILMDGINQLEEEKEYKEENRSLYIEVTEYLNEYKAVKRQVFDLIKTIMKHNKQKRLLK
ncbi:hypothetical protein [Aquimarina intermedia]|uniref:Uncharacterized protein n=1 Tax=Aquimarina intermedia TaxID=350814 RepID=A0A5S5C540_9FLAO|nr:hypothetical protein [Aquimarina intermedia]TYP74249.1 hypothetical protein BD809_10467 [Aquimarina intermedia]